MSRPLDRTCRLPERGKVDKAAGEFWVENPFQMPEQGKNLSAYENNRLFMNLDGIRFVDASFGSRTDLDADSRSVITADFNRDGRADLLVANVGGGPLRLFLSDLGDLSGGFVRVFLQGTSGNREAIGSRVEAWCGDRRIVRDVFFQNGCMGQGPAEICLGLEQQPQIDRLRVRWPDGTWQEYGSVPAGSDVVIQQSAAQPQITPYRSPLPEARLPR